jgi:hypothetical protein
VRAPEKAAEQADEPVASPALGAGYRQAVDMAVTQYTIVVITRSL